MTRKEYQHNYYLKNKDAIKTQRIQKNPPKIASVPKTLDEKREYTRRWRKENPEKVKQYGKNAKQYQKHYTLKSKYGITFDQYNEMLAKQNGVCAICKQPEVSTLKQKIKLLSVDHSHSTGNVRALLCTNCNMILGKAHEDTNLLLKCVDNLNKHAIINNI